MDKEAWRATVHEVTKSQTGRGGVRGGGESHLMLPFQKWGEVSPHFFCADGHSPRCPDAEDLDTPLSW